MESNLEIGKIGEEVALRYLKQKGYEIIDRNFYCKQGEIDIITSFEEQLVFVEVKTRRSIYFGNPAEAVNEIKQKHRYQSAKYYLHIKNMENMNVRFDVIEIYIFKNRCKVNHIKQII